MPSVTERPAEATTKAPSASDITREQYRILLALTTLAAAFVRFWHLGSRGLLIDEGFSWFTTTISWPEMLRSLTTRNAQMSIHYILIHLWSVVGDSEFALRSISAIFGIATVPLVAFLGTRLYSRKVGALAAALFTFHVFAVQYSQELRTYPVAMFFVTLSWIFFADALKGNSTRPWVLYAIATILGFYSHFFVAFNIAAQAVTLIFLPAGWNQWRRARITALALVAAFLPAIVYSLRTNTEDLNWIKSTNRTILWEFLDRFTGMSGSVWQGVFVSLLIALLAFGFVGAAFRARRSWTTWDRSFPVLGMLVPFFLLILVSVAKPLFVPRYIGYTVVPLVIGLAWLCCSLQPRFGIVGATALIALFAWPLPAYYRQPAFWDFRGAANYVSLHCAPGDGIVVWEPMARPAVEFYGRQHPGFPEFIYPQTDGRFHVEDMLQRPDPYALPSLLAQHSRIWIVYDLPAGPAEFNLTPALYFERVMERTHRQVSVRQFQNARVEEYVRQ